MVSTAEKAWTDAFSTTSLADPDTFMAIAGREDGVKTPSTKSFIKASSGNAESPRLSGQEASSVSQDLIMLDPHDTNFHRVQKSPSQGTRKETMPDLLCNVDSQPVINFMPMEGLGTKPSPSPKQISHPGQGSLADDNSVLKDQRTAEQDCKQLQRFKEIVAQMGGVFKADLLSHIESWEAKLGSQTTIQVKPPNANQTPILAKADITPVLAEADETPTQAHVPQRTVSAQADRVAEVSVNGPAFIPQDFRSAVATSQPIPSQAQEGPGIRRDSIASNHTAPSSAGASQVKLISKPSTLTGAAAPPKHGGMLPGHVKSLTPPLIGIKTVKQETVKIGALIGEHVFQSRYLTRPRTDSVASSVASTTEDTRSLSAGFSQLSLQPKDSPLASVARPLPVAVTPSATTVGSKVPDKTSLKSTISLPTSLIIQGNRTARQSPGSVENYEPMIVKSPASTAVGKPSEAGGSNVTSGLPMRQTPRLMDNVFTRQYSSQSTSVTRAPQSVITTHSSVNTMPPEPRGTTVGRNLTMWETPRMVDNTVSRQHSSQRTGASEAPPSIAAAPSTGSQNNTIVTVEETSTPLDDALTRQPHAQHSGSHEPKYASLNPFAQRPPQSATSQASSGTSLVPENPPSRQSSASFSKRYDTAPYRSDETAAPKAKLKVPDFLTASSSNSQDAGAAARRQYGDPSNLRFQPGVLTERVQRQMTSFPATSTGPKFSKGPSSITAPSPIIRSAQGPATSEHVRLSVNKGSQHTAQGIP